MNPESSQRPTNDMPARLALVQAATDGKLDGLACPKCACETVSVYFTQPVHGEFHTWFVCSNCDFSMRAQNSTKPAHYSVGRDRTGKKTAAAS